MSDVTLEQFRLRFPEFDDIADSRIQLALNDTAIYVSQTRFGDFYQQAYTHLAAVFLCGMIKTGGRDGSGHGSDPSSLPVITQQAGSVLLTTAEPDWKPDSVFDKWLSLTVYGQRFLGAREMADNAISAV